MDLRSSHKEKPPPRLRLSLTRAMSTDVDQGERAGMYRRSSWRKSRQRVSKRGPEGPLHKTIRSLRKKEKPVEEAWDGTSEEEKPESESTKERCEDSLYGQFPWRPLKLPSYDLLTFLRWTTFLFFFSLHQVSQSAAPRPCWNDRT